MTTTPYRHLGGAMLTDFGPVGLAHARALALFYRAEAQSNNAEGMARPRDLCLRRADALDAAVADAVRWRRAAGWADPDQADRQAATLPSA